MNNPKTIIQQPEPFAITYPCIDLRDYFAAAALTALISLESDADEKGIAHDAYLYADALLAKRSRTP